MPSVANIDSLYLQVELDYYPGVFWKVLEELEQRKSIGDTNEFEYEVNGMKFIFQARGYQSWPFALITDEFTLYLSRPKSRAYNMNCYLVVRQQALWLKGLDLFFQQFINLCHALNFRVSGHKISRLDLCVHTDEIKLTRQFLNNLHYDPKCNRENFNIIDEFGSDNSLMVWERLGKMTGIRIGTGKPLMCRIYDKSLEIKITKKLWFNEIWDNLGLDIDNVVNVEYQIRREFLKEIKVDTITELKESLGEIWSKVAIDFVSFRHNDNNRRSRRKLTKIWSKIVTQNFNYNGQKSVREVSYDLDKEKIVEGLFGYLTSYMASTGKEDLADDVIIELLDDMNDYLFSRNKRIENEVSKKVSKNIKWLAKKMQKNRPTKAVSGDLLD